MVAYYNETGMPKDRFMYKTVVDIADEHGITDNVVIDKVYEELYMLSDERGKSWNCKMIDELVLKYANEQRYTIKEDKRMKDLNEEKELCVKILISWVIRSSSGVNMSEHNAEIAETFIARMLAKKFEVFGIDVVLPDELIIMLDVCCNSNPGMIQMVLADLLESISKRLKGIPKGYVITADDFTQCFSTQFPIIDEDACSKKYEKMWDSQKKAGKLEYLESDNLCDTPEFWLRFMRKED